MSYRPVDCQYLIHHWSGAYQITVRRGRYLAARKDDGRILVADTADALLGMIRADYAQRPVPR